jgi:hypothetical protein
VGRKPKLRVSFYDDILYLMRLSHALEADTALPKAWRFQMAEKCKALGMEFQNAPQRKPIAESKTEKAS